MEKKDNPTKNPAHNPPKEDEAIKSAKGTGKDLSQTKGEEGQQKAPKQKHDGRRLTDKG